MTKRNTYFQDEVVQRKVDLRQFGRIMKYIMPYKAVFVCVGFLMLMSAAAANITPKVIEKITNLAKVGKEYDMLIKWATVLTLIAFTEILITFAHQRLMGITGHKIIADIREEIFEKLQKLPFDYFDSRPDGKIVVRVTDYINDLANFFANYVIMFLVYAVKIVLAAVFMLITNVWLALVVFAAVIPMMACVFALRYSIRKLFPHHRAKISNRTAFLVESIMGGKIIRNYNRADENMKIYHEVHMESVNMWMRIVKRNELNTPIVEIFWNIGSFGLYATALYMIINGGNAGSAITAGMLMAFTQYMTQFSGPLTQIAIIIQQLAQVSSNLEQVFDTIDYPVEIADKKDAVVLENISGKIDFNNVTFSYDQGVNILENFNLHVRPGETIALVGPTGAGKTTVINMLTRFYDVNEGSVMIDGIDVRDATLESLRKEIGVLMQDPFIFKGSIIENIRYGRTGATDEECIKAAETIHADIFINRLPDGYYHMLDEHGAGLSAGEKQLLSFARIILKNPSVIILDEATSSIDTETEKMIKQDLDVITKEKTTFMVAHRLSTIRNADRILYISDKGIAEQGTHEELMALKGLYYSLN